MSIIRAVHLVRNQGYSRFLSSASAPDTRSPALVDILKRSRAAQLEYSSFTQKQVDKIFFDAALAGNGARLPLAEMAVAETKKGVVEDKVRSECFCRFAFLFSSRVLRIC
jgi:acetaldehyde dehydrogenase/alcohol dehydrogenase